MFFRYAIWGSVGAFGAGLLLLGVNTIMWGFRVADIAITGLVQMSFGGFLLAGSIAKLYKIYKRQLLEGSNPAPGKDQIDTSSESLQISPPPPVGFQPPPDKSE